MSYIGNSPLSVAFLVDTFSGNGSTVAFTMSVAPANTSSILVAVTGVVQDPSTYSVSGTTLTFSAAPPSGTSNISVRYLGIPASGVTTTAYRTVTDTTATAGQTTFTIPSYTVGYVDVFRNGVRLAAADFTATTGTTIVLASAASAGDTITTVSFYVSSVLNAIQQYNGLSVNQVLTTPTANTLTSASGSSLQLQTNGGTAAVTIDTSQNVGIGTSSPAVKLDVSGRAQFVNSAFNYVTVDSTSSDSYLRLAAAGAVKWYFRNNVSNSNALEITPDAGSSTGLFLNQSGNLGLGTTTPLIYGTFARQFTLQASTGYSNISVAGGDGGGIDFGTATIRQAGIYSLAGSALGFYTNSTNSGFALAEKARIDTSGRLLVGTSTSYTDYANIQVRGDNKGIAIQDSTDNSYRAIYNQSGTLYFWNGSNEGYLSTSGAWTNASDARLKTNVREIEYGLSTVLATQPRHYERVDIDGTYIGFVAQELQTVIPEVVSGNPEKQLGVDYGSLVAIAFKAIQEQQAIITQLQADVAALKGQA
jgi:hypothetical protein